MLKILRKKLKLTIEGEIEVKEPSVSDFKKWASAKIKEQKEEEIYKYLKTTFPNEYTFDIKSSIGYDRVLKDIAKYLANQECEDEQE